MRPSPRPDALAAVLDRTAVVEAHLAEAGFRSHVAADCRSSLADVGVEGHHAEVVDHRVEEADHHAEVADHRAEGEDHRAEEAVLHGVDLEEVPALVHHATAVVLRRKEAAAVRWVSAAVARATRQACHPTRP